MGHGSGLKLRNYLVFVCFRRHSQDYTRVRSNCEGNVGQPSHAVSAALADRKKAKRHISTGAILRGFCRLLRQNPAWHHYTPSQRLIDAGQWRLHNPHGLPSLTTRAPSSSTRHEPQNYVCTNKRHNRLRDVTRESAETSFSESEHEGRCLLDCDAHHLRQLPGAASHWPGSPETFSNSGLRLGINPLPSISLWLTLVSCADAHLDLRYMRGMVVLVLALPSSAPTTVMLSDVLRLNVEVW
jgi:hypothetical protein